MPPATLFSKVPVIPGLGQHKVIQLQAAWDWTQFFNTLNVRMMGHTSTAAKKATHETAIHVFRFVLRKDIEDYVFSEAPVHDEVETAWPHLESRPDDVIMMTKLYMSSTSLSQPPMVFCPAVLLNKLNIKDLQLAPSAVLTDRQKKELGKSATYFEGPTLSMQKAAEYLRSLTKCDGSPQGIPEPCPWLFDDAKVIQYETVSDDGDPDPALGAAGSLANPSAARVSVGPVGKPKARISRKRPASADEAATAAPAVPEASAGAPPSAMDGLAPPGAGVPADSADTGRGRGRGRGTAKAKADAGRGRGGRGRGKAKAKADAGRGRGGRGRGRGRGGVAFDFPPLQPGQSLGCSKCRQLPNGCGDCRTALGWKHVHGRTWVIDPDADV